MASNDTYPWILPAALIVLLLAFLGCSGTSSATRLFQKNINDTAAVQLQEEPVAAPETTETEQNVLENDIPTREETRKRVLGAYLDNNSSGFARLGKRVDQTGKATYYPQLQHYFRTNENSYESIIQGKTKKKNDPSVPPLEAPKQEKEMVDNPKN